MQRTVMLSEQPHNMSFSVCHTPYIHTETGLLNPKSRFFLKNTTNIVNYLMACADTSQQITNICELVCFCVRHAQNISKQVVFCFFFCTFAF